MAIVEVTVAPTGTPTTSLSRYVAGCERVLAQEAQAKGLKYELHAMGTIIEGDLDNIMAVVRRMHEVPFQEGAMRVNTIIRIDDRRDKQASMAQKLRSVKEKLVDK